MTIVYLPFNIPRMAIPIRKSMMGFRVLDKEREAIVKQARVLKLRLSEYIRLCVLNDMKERKP